MIKIFLFLFLSVVSFFATGQDRVCIAASTARYFLEQADRAAILTEKDSLNQLVINNQDKVISFTNRLIESYKQDSITYNKIITTKDEELEYKNDSIKLAKKEIRKQKTIKWVFVILTGALIAKETF